MTLRVCAVLVLTLLTMSRPVQAAGWFPVETGRSWVYSSPGGASSSVAVGAQESFAGSLVQPFLWDAGTREYFSQDGSGRVFQHGVAGAPDGSYLVFDPPFLRMDSDLTPGHEWVVDYDAVEYSAAGLELQRSWGRTTYRVIGLGSVEEPAGTFDAAEILTTRELESLPTYTFRDWYSEGTGWIRRTEQNGTTVLFELESYGPGSVTTDATAWGAVKAQYQD